MTAIPEMTFQDDHGLTGFAAQLSTGSDALFEQYDGAPSVFAGQSPAEDACENLYPSPR